MSTTQSRSTALTITHTTTVMSPGNSKERDEQLAIETPYTITLNDETIGSSMVLPVGLEEFGAGFLFGQGYIKKAEEVKEVYICPDGRIAVYADVNMTEPKEVIITSGCGGTGKISKEMLEDAFEPLQDYTITFPEINSFIRQALSNSTLGHDTHCVHGCALWQNGKMQAFFEDVGFSIYLHGYYNLNNTEEQQVEFEYTYIQSEDFKIENPDGFEITADMINNVWVMFDLNALLVGVDLSVANVDEDGVIRLNKESNNDLADIIESNLEAASELGLDEDGNGEIDD